MQTSIRTRLTLSHLAVIVIAMSLSGFLLLSLLERYFLEAIEDSLAAQAQITAQALVPGAVAAGPLAGPEAAAFNTLQQRSSNISLQTQNIVPPKEEIPLGDIDLNYLTDASLQLSSQLETRIRILDAQGVVLVDSRQEDQGTDLHTDPLVQQALAGQSASHIREGHDRPNMFLAAPVFVDETLVGAVYLGQPLNDVNAVLADLRMRWLLSTLAALLLSVLVGLVLSGAIARPLGRLTSAARAVARGDLDQQVPATSRDELGHLSRAFNDMTARLRAARQMQTDFVANVSHELRTPLTAIKGLVETLRDGAIDDITVRDHFLETMESETDRLIRLVMDLLILSRADSEALNLHCEWVDLRQWLPQTLQKLQPQADARGIELAFETDAQLPAVLIDRDRIEQVLLNLLDNALKYSLPGGTIAVQAWHNRPQVVSVQVEDEGIGIPASDLPRIGERFYRSDRARSRAQGGSGLGLAIARALVRAHGGELSLASQEGQGTVVTFTLPCS